MTKEDRQSAPAEVRKSEPSKGAEPFSGVAAAPAPEGAGAGCHPGGGHMGFLKMAACCAAPILLLAALPFLGGVLGVTGASLLSALAFLACPAAMGFMMWRMSRQQAAVPSQVNPPVTVAENVLEEPAKEARS